MMDPDNVTLSNRDPDEMASSRGDSEATNEEQQDETSSEKAAVNIAHSNVCDRRLSRAARSLVKRHLLSILKSQVKGDEDDKTINESIWSLLNRSLSPTASAANCPLIPSKDILKHHEEQAQQFRTSSYKKSSPRSGVPIRAAIYQQTRRDWQRYPWYQCGFCGKTFSSRFYLDQHMDNHHAHELGVEHDSNNSQQNWICPAASWCPALPFCSQHALTLEPYYGRGSGGLSTNDRDEVHRALWHQAHPEVHDHHHSGCDEHAMYKAKLRCYKMIHDCFGTANNEKHEDSNASNLQHSLEHSLCDAITCPNRLHQWFFAATESTNGATELMRQHVHEWQDEWSDYYSHHHEIGWLGGFVVVALLIGYSCYFLCYHQGDDGNAKYLRRKDPRGSRLLQKKRPPSSSTSFFERVNLFRKSSTHAKAKNH